MTVPSLSPWQQSQTSQRLERNRLTVSASQTTPSGGRACSQCPCSSSGVPAHCPAHCPPWPSSRWMPCWGLRRRCPWIPPPPGQSCAASARVASPSRAPRGCGATRTPGCPLVVSPLRHCTCRCSWLSEGVGHSSQRGRAWIQHGSASSAQYWPVNRKQRN